MAILYPISSRAERLPLPSTEEIAAFMDTIRGESMAELDYDAPPRAVDVAAQTDAWEYDKTYRPGEYQRRRDEIELGAALRRDGAA